MAQFFKDTWNSIVVWWGRVGPKLIGPLIAVGAVLGGVILMLLNLKKSAIGGAIGKAVAGEEDPVGQANTVDKDRVNKDGKPILPGVADSKGNTQAIVVPIEKPGLFESKDHVSVTAPGTDTKEDVPLPQGVTAKDVEQVTVIKPELTEVKVTDSSGIKPDHLRDLINKYKK